MTLTPAVALLALASLAVGVPAGARAKNDAVPAVPGISVHDPRVRVDPETVPWRAVGKLQVATVNLRAMCTATLVGPSMVLTAAHCLYNPRTRRNFRPDSVHFLIGYDGGRYAGHAVGVSIETGSDFDPGRPKETSGSDWALASIDKKLGSPDRVLPILATPPEVGTTVVLGGYQQDHPLILTADTECRIVGRLLDPSGRTLLRHDCTGTRGVSGAPLLVEKAGRWFVAAIDVAAQPGIAGGAAVILDEARNHL